MRVFFCPLLPLSLIVVCLLQGCKQADQRTLEVTLYALDGPAMDGAGYSIPGLGVYDPAKDYEPEQLFHEYPILGQVDLTGTEQAEGLASVLEDRVASEQGLIAGCFIPRHGLRVVRDGVTTDYVVCFQCTNFLWYEDGQAHRTGQQSITKKHAPVFSGPLLEAGIDLASGVGDQ